VIAGENRASKWQIDESHQAKMPNALIEAEISSSFRNAKYINASGACEN